MKNFRWLSGLMVVLGGAALLHASGCIITVNFDDCAVYPHAGCGVGGGSSSSSMTSTSGTGGGGAPPECIPSESTDPVDDSCGVFVSSSLGADDMAADRGTKAKPFKSISAALKKADVTRVYACAESFTDAVTISAAVDLYGGLDCKSWAYVGATMKTHNLKRR
jgi:hypothetical protein